MALPAPPVPLRDHCSVIYNRTLYVYSPEGFQSLPLRDGAQWSRLSMDVSVRGARCVKAIPRGDESQAALYIVGGATNSSTSDYAGLQRYRFANRSWEVIKPSVSVTQNRRNHGAVFLNASTSILTYAGSQDTAEAQLSSQTFLLSLEPPFTVTSYSSKAPPLVRPLLLPWTDREAIMVGGDATSRRVYTFSKESGWADADFELERPLPDDSKAQAVIIDGDDGGKTLVSFDLSVSPNRVDRTVLRRENATQSAPISSSPSSSARSSFRSTSSSSSSSSSSSPTSSTAPRTAARSDDGEESRPPAKRRKRDTDDAGAVPAPTTVRRGFSVANEPNGLVVITGDSEQDPLSMFDAPKDIWVDPKELLGAKSSAPSSSATPSPSSTSRSSSSTSASGATGSATAGSSTGGDGGRSNTLRILGATLGSIFGVALLLVLALLFLRWRRRKRWYDDAGRRRRASGVPDDEKDRLSFADRGASFMSQAGGSRGHGHQDSSSSVAIMLGHASRRDRSGVGASSQQQHPSALTPGTGPGATVTVPDPTFSSATTTTTVVGADAGSDRQRSSGWSRYFLGNPNTTDLAEETTETTTTTSLGSLGGQQSRAGAGTAAAGVAATPINFSRACPSQRIKRQPDDTITPPAAVATRRGDEHGDYLHIQPGSYVQRLESLSSNGSSRSRSEHAPGAHEDSAWSPVAREEWSSGRGTSSVYTDSAHGSMLPRDFNPALFPQVPRDSTVTTFPRGSSSAPTRRSGTSEVGGRESGGVMVPGMSEYDTRRHSGMSWLNLGNSREEGEP